MPRCLNPRCGANNAVGSVVCANCGCLLAGAVVAGRYRVESLLGLGGMGAVYQADDMFEMQQVALKVISTASSTLDILMAEERFRREARYAHQLKHKNIVQVLNFGQDGTLLYLVMPLVTGGTLKVLLKGERPLPVAQTQRYLNDIADAIDAVHAHPQQIIHRDLKPSNLLIHQDDGRLVLADFGIARAMQQESPLTQRGLAVGTEHYIAPEQEAGNAEPASDIYAMGVVAYQMLTGLLPYQAAVRYHLSEIPLPSKINPALPATLDPLIMRAMDVEPAKRYPSARAFADAVNDVLNAHPAVSSAPSLADMPTLPISLPAVAPETEATQAQVPALTNNASIMVRIVVPENPCSACGQENRNSSRFCRRCGHALNDTAPLVTEGCKVGYISDPGRQHVSEVNEDMLLVVQGLCANLAPPPRPYGLFAVADGLRRSGKTAIGHEASRLAVETVADVLPPQLSTPLPPGSSSLSLKSGRATGRTPARSATASAPQDALLVEQWLRECVRRANQVICHCNTDYDTEMASTLALALVYKHHLYVVNVGDCRLYHYRAGQGLQLITKDHTLAANLVEAQLLTPEELYKSAKRNQHYRYLGQSTPVQVDFFQQEVKAGDLILLCSDGLWHMLRDDRLQELLAQGQSDDPQRLARTLVDAANLAGGEGNVSAIVVKIQ